MSLSNYYQTDLSQPVGRGVDFGGATSSILTWILWILVAILLTILSVNAIRFYQFWKINKNKKLMFLEITLPKDTPDDVDKDKGRKDENQLVSISENIYQVIGHYSQTFFWQDWIYGSPSFSFEIIKHRNKISFYVAAPEDCIDTIEKQIISTFNRCRILKHDNLDHIFKGVGVARELVLKKGMELPFRTYTQISGDPMNTIVNAMEIAQDDQTIAIQLVLSPISNWWQAKGRGKAHKMQNEKNKDNIASESGAHQTKSFWKKEDENAMGGGYLTPNQQNIVKRLEEKASRPGFRFACRVAAFGKSKEDSNKLLNNLMPAFKIYDIDPFNGLTERKLFMRGGLGDIPRYFVYDQLRDFLNRNPAMSNNAIMNVEETTSIWHLPNYLVQSPTIDWMMSYKPILPTNLPQDPNYGVLMGYADGGYFQKPVYQSVEDRTRHSYILGGSGSGKSVFMVNAILADIKAGHGVCVVDPHGELVDDVLFRMPKDRMDDVAIISPAFIDAPNGFNILYTDPLKPEQKTIVINNLFQIWNKLYDMQSAGGPQFEYYMKNAARLVMGHIESGNTLMEISKVFSDKDFREFKIAMCTEPDVVDFWMNQANKAKGEQSLENMTTYITSKLAPFITNDFIRPMIGQCDNTINIRKCMDNKKIIMVKLEKGLIGEMSMYLIGMMMISNILISGMGRADGLRYNMDGTTEPMNASQRPPFFVYVDEMQNFLFDAIPQALEEIRKYKVGFSLANQFVKQIISKGDERIKDSIMANTGSKFIFNCGIDDAEYLEKEFRPILTAKDLMNPERFTCNVRVMLNGQKTQPFNMRSVGGLKDEDIDRESAKFMIEQSKLLYGTPLAEVNRDILERSNIKL
jgi:flagellar basal body-associated protein FliL